MPQIADFVDEIMDDGSHAIRMTGTFAIAQIGTIDDRLRGLSSRIDYIDLSAIEHIDTIGAWIIHRTAQDHSATIIGADADAQNLIAAVSENQHKFLGGPPRPSALSRMLNEIGSGTVVAWRTMFGFLAFLGQCVSAGVNLVLHPRRFRGHAVIQHFDMVGVRALAIIGLMSFLIGIVIAQQGAAQLREFGAEVFTINLVGRLSFRELGILMTAIMVAGRSGSAFAAQIGSMKITEEVDAMRTIGVSPIEALVIPRVFASIIMMPLLGVFASMMSVIGGGLLCWIVLEIPPLTFIQRLREVVPMQDLYVCIVKAPVFGAIIALAGCFQGMQVEGNSEQVGRRTTAAVVQAIFLVIVLDAFFAVFFSTIGWD